MGDNGVDYVSLDGALGGLCEISPVQPPGPPGETAAFIR